MHPTRAAHERWIPTNLVPARGRAASVTALSLALAVTLLGADAARANTLTFPALSPGARATVPMTIAVSGDADPSASLRVYVQQGGDGCAGEGSGLQRAQAQAMRPGSTEVINRQPFGPFSVQGTYTPPAAGPYSACAYLFGASPGASASTTSSSFTVGPAPPPPAPPAGTNQPPSASGVPGTVPRPKRCVVPALKGRTYLGARKLIRRAGCSVGTVYRPSLATARGERSRGRVLRVVLQYPKPRSVRKLNSRLLLRLAYVNPPRRSTR